MNVRPGDVLLRGSLSHGFDVVDAATGELLVERVRSLTQAVDIARRQGRGDLWREHADANGRALGEPERLGPLQ